MSAEKDMGTLALALGELSWARVALALLCAVLLPLILHRIFYHKRARLDSSAGSCSLEDYMLKHGMGELDAKFQVAVDFIASSGGNRLSNEQRLTLYAFYKQAHFGKCTIEKPSAADFVGSAKWESWKALGDMDQEAAKQQYLQEVQDLFDDFDVRAAPAGAKGSAAAPPQAKNEELMLGGTMVGAVSMPKVDMTTEEWKVTEDVFHFASTGEVAKLVAALSNGTDIDAQDDEGRTMLHWAVDREQAGVVEELLKRAASPNVQDADGMTALHYAASCDHEEMARLLVDHGAFTDVEDGDGDTPLTVASSDAMQSILSTGKRREE